MYCLQVILILNTVLYAMLCFVTLPIYSLGVHMGADYKRHILPTSVQQRMMCIAQDTKLKVSLAPGIHQKQGMENHLPCKFWFSK